MLSDVLFFSGFSWDFKVPRTLEVFKDIRDPKETN
jgi:hypothetical protein